MKTTPQMDLKKTESHNGSSLATANHHIQCNCEAKMKLNILLVLDHPHESLPPTQSQPHLIIQFIEFTYYDDRFSLDVTTKETKYDISINNIICQGWQVEPLITLSWC